MTTGTYPFFSDWDRTGSLPDFRAITPDMFLPAYRQAMTTHRREVDTILNNPAAATYDNTLVPLELAGRNLRRVGRIFNLISSAMSSKAIQAIEEEISPELSRHYDEISLHPKMFERIDTLHQQRAQLDPEARRLVEERHRGLVLAGALLPQAQKDRLMVINEQTSGLHTRFNNNLLNEVDEKPLLLQDRAALAGISDSTLAELAETAARAGQTGYAIRLQRETVEPLLRDCTVRDTRQRLHEAFINRGNNNDAFDNKAIIPQLLALREEEAHLLGFPDYAHRAIAVSMAKTPAAALQLMTDLWAPAKVAMAREQTRLEAAAAADGLTGPLQPWDWIHYAEKVRQQDYDLNEAELKPYLSLDNVRRAVFGTAEKLFGIEFRPRQAEAWHPDVDAYDVHDKASGKRIALFLTDYFARDGKQPGAWMSSLADGHGLDGGQLPIVYNVCNFSRPAAGNPALLSWVDAITLAHECGHALHGMLTRVRHPSLGGTNVYSDFVELPSQLMEHWMSEPLVMREHLRHVGTGAPIPDVLIDRIRRAATFNEGFEMVRYLGSAIMDLELHQIRNPAGLDILRTEQEILTRYGMPPAGQLMHRPMHHDHLFSGTTYAAGYYVYGWAAVLDHDAHAAFTETGDPFHPPTAALLHEHIYSSGNSEDPEIRFRNFRGRDPDRAALLKKKGFTVA